MAQGAGESSRPQLELWPRSHRSGDLSLRLIGADGRVTDLTAEYLAQSIAAAGAPGDAVDWDTALSLARAAVAFLRHSNEPEPFPFAVVVRTVERTLRGMGLARTAQLYVRSHGNAMAIAEDVSLDGFPWNALIAGDRMRGAIESWTRRAAIDERAAGGIVSTVLEQFDRAGMTEATPVMLREAVVTLLLRRGMTENAERIACVPVPLHEIESTLFDEIHPAGAAGPAADVVASLTSRVYGYARVFPERVSAAHVRGDIFIESLADLFRLEAAALEPEDLTEHGPTADPDGLAREIKRQSRRLSPYFNRFVRWNALNFGFAPILHEMDDARLRHLALGLLLESARVDPAAGAPSIVFDFSWDVPDGAPRRLPGPGEARVELEDTYGPARRFFGATVDVLAGISGRHVGAGLPDISLTLSPYFFGAPDGGIHLEKIARTIANGYPLTLRYEPAKSLTIDPVYSRRPAEVFAQTVSVSLTRAAEAATGLRGFLARIEEATDDAVSAHLARHAQLTELVRNRSGALAPLLRGIGRESLLDVNALRYRVTVTGAGSMLGGTSWLAAADAPVALDTAFAQMRTVCDRWSASTGRSIRLAGPAGDDELRTDALDARQHLAMRGAFHPHFSDPAPCVVPRGAGLSTTDGIAEFIRWAFLYTPCRALRLR